ncbi:uncharacterized protein LOC110907377 [Helianthus annuus]|uniref:uncharacterized protein LOC110907377 n=1 Tax=Helianthus annuus TaxID=4232 RepID=UPI000B8EF26B|nr:uncharacterized protein LOC110907377 [Helianthus annuus]
MTTAVSTVMTSAVSTVMTSAVTVTTGLVTPLPNAVSHAEKPEKFSGVNFKQRQQKMFFYLTTLNLARFLTESKPHVDEGDMDGQSVSTMHAWNHSDFRCRNFILNGLVDTLYNVYCKAKNAKELWESLDRKYKTEDAGTKKFVVILHDIHAEGMMLSETFQVAAMIEKLPPSWVDFKNYLKRQQSGPKKVDGPETVKANLVEHGQSSKGKNSGKGGKKSHGKRSNLGPKGGVGKKKFQGTCYNCQKQGHKASECKLPKKENA